MANPQSIDASPESSGGKSPEAFRTISEVATELDLPQHVLRFWETRFASVRPLKRSGGRRYYRPEDVALLRRIRDLLRDKGYTIKGVQKLLRQGGDRSVSIEVAAEAPTVLYHPTTAPADPATPTGLTASDDIVRSARVSPPGGDEDPLLSPTAREELQGILAELEALRALLKAG